MIDGHRPMVLARFLAGSAAEMQRPRALTETGTRVCRYGCGLVQPLDNGRVSHAAALAHGLRPVASAPLFKRTTRT
jgi:hypothetical protein